MFWSLSFAEWRALLSPQRAPALDRAGFETLMNAFPD
ncbi:phage tail assembly chaperone [Rhizomicrobium electricum]|nr:hypothetical protein [Rhizomicrobium electricum]